ncbi:UNVERIFIED_CONTAM: hypothetical protein PYX00_011249 [Menopon gallinae]|uniref:Rho-GAP domain-containing protein n=1 Tax=Menopon gallinae TaxID=328185 RepID=A0AAW2H679_9NEOP
MFEDRKLIEITDENRMLFARNKFLKTTRAYSTGSLVGSTGRGLFSEGLFQRKEDEVRERAEEIREKRIRYEHLTGVDQVRLSTHSIKKINALCQEPGIRTFFRKLGSLVGKSHATRQDCVVSPQVYKIIDYISENGLEHMGVFRITGNFVAYRGIVGRLVRNEQVECSRYTIDDLASALKAYIREEVGGIIPESVCDCLIKIYKSRNYEKAQRAKTYLPFVFCGERRTLLRRVVELFKSLEEKSAVNRMPISNLVSVMPCTFFPKSFCLDYKTAIVMYEKEMPTKAKKKEENARTAPTRTPTLLGAWLLRFRNSTTAYERDIAKMVSLWFLGPSLHAESRCTWQKSLHTRARVSLGTRRHMPSVTQRAKGAWPPLLDISGKDKFGVLSSACQGLMEIEVDVFGSKEVDVHPQERRRRRRADDYDYTDPFIEQLEGEDDVVEMEPHIQNFFMHEGPLQDRPSKVLSAHRLAEKKACNRRETPAKPADIVHCMQNLIYARMLDGTCTEADVLDFLLYDLIVNHDTKFEKAKEKLGSLDSAQLLSTEFVKTSMDALRAAADSWHEKVSLALSKDDLYDNSNIIFTEELCDAVFHYVDAKVKVDTYNTEVSDCRKINYHNARKSAYAQVYSMLREGTKNHKQLGYYVYKHTRKQKIGRYNGFRPVYLSTEREVESGVERTLDTLSSAGEAKRSQECARGGEEEDSLSSQCARSQKNTNECKLQDAKAHMHAECSAREGASSNNSWSLQKVETQWLDTLPENTKDEDSGPRKDD